MKKTLRERFDEKWVLDIETSCWLWISSINRDGYGHISFCGQSHKAHRISYELFISSIPQGLEIDHICRVRNCVNPDHLEVVTHKENVIRGVGSSKAGVRIRDFHLRKTHCPRKHEYTSENTRIYKGRRYYRQCCIIHSARQCAKRRCLLTN